LGMRNWTHTSFNTSRTVDVHVHGGGRLALHELRRVGLWTGAGRALYKPPNSNNPPKGPKGEGAVDHEQTA